MLLLLTAGTSEPVDIKAIYTIMILQGFNKLFIAHGTGSSILPLMNTGFQ